MAFVGSMSGTTTLVGQAAYGTAKAALHQLVAGAARELGARKVRVNAVAPGFARTPRLNSMFDESQWADIGRCIPLGSAAVPSEIAGPLLFLVSDLASHVTGQTLAVDGGLAHTIAMPTLW